MRQIFYFIFYIKKNKKTRLSLIDIQYIHADMPLNEIWFLYFFFFFLKKIKENLACLPAIHQNSLHLFIFQDSLLYLLKRKKENSVLCSNNLPKL